MSREFFTRRRRLENQRVNRPRRKRLASHQLDVRMSTKKTSRQRLVQQSCWVIKIAAVALTLLSLTASVKWVYRKVFFENTDFRLRELTIHSNGVLSGAQVLAASGISEGMNLIEIDLVELREKIESLPLVEEAVVTRELPNRLSVEISERRPVAWLSCPPKGIRPRSTTGGVILDGEGIVIPCESLAREFLKLPIIESHTLSRLVPGSKIDSPQIQSALKLLALTNHRFMARGIDVREVRIRNDYSLTALFNNDMMVTVGLPDMDRAMGDLELILEHSVRENRNLATVNLMPEKNIPVTYFEAPVHLDVPVLPSSVDVEANAEGSSGGDQRAKHLRAILSRGG